MVAASHKNQDLQKRAEKLRNCRLEFVSTPSFEHPEIAETLNRGIADFEARLISRTPDTTHYLTGLYSIPLLTKPEEHQLFEAMNFLKYKANLARKRLHPTRPSASRIVEIERLLSESIAVRNHIVRANLRLVVALAKKFGNQSLPMEELICEGHFPLMHAVELFDYSRGNRFSTYATWAVRNHFLRLLKEEQKLQLRFLQTDPDTIPVEETTPPPIEDFDRKHRQKRRQVNRLLARLSDRERVVVAARFGLTEDAQEQTLSQIGREMGISKERVRQLTLRSLEKLKGIARKHSGEASCQRSKREHSSNKA